MKFLNVGKSIYTGVFTFNFEIPEYNLKTIEKLVRKFAKKANYIDDWRMLKEIYKALETTQNYPNKYTKKIKKIDERIKREMKQC